MINVLWILLAGMTSTVKIFLVKNDESMNFLIHQSRSSSCQIML